MFSIYVNTVIFYVFVSLSNFIFKLNNVVVENVYRII